MDKTPSVRQSADALAKLKEILLSEDQLRIDVLKEELEKLKSRIEDSELLIETLEPVIAELMEKKIIASRHEMAEILSPIMSAAIKKQVEYAKDEVVDALYPVIGKTIRRSIAEAMRNLVRTVNDRVERALSPRQIFQRIKARVSGVSPGDLILKESMPFQVHELFLIHKETGILLAHISDMTSHPGANQELISGMLTAIKDFAQTLFSGGEARDLHEIQYEDRQIRLEVGQFAYLACITSGIPPDNFTDEIAQLIYKVHRNFLPALRDFEGDMGVFQSVQPILGRFIHHFDRQPSLVTEDGTVERKRFRFGFVFLSGLLIIVLGVFLGVFVIPKKTAVKKVGQTLAELEKEFPALAKAGLQFKVHRKSVTVSGQVLQITDKETIEDRLVSLPSVREVINGIEVVPWAIDPERLYKEVRGSLEDFSLDLSQVKFVIEDGVLYVRGTAASQEDRERIIETLADFTSLPVIIDNIRLDRTFDGQRMRQDIEETVLHFSTGQSESVSLDLDKLMEIRDKLKHLDFQQLQIIGHADDTGTSDINLWLSQKRAEWIKSFLVESGIPDNKLTVVARGSEDPVSLEKTEQARALNRRVVFVFRQEEQVPR